MRFTVSNQTCDSVLCQFRLRADYEHTIRVPPFSHSDQFSPKLCTSLVLSRYISPKELSKAAGNASSMAVKLSMAPRRKWQRVTEQDRFPWTVYRNQLSRKHHVLVVFPYRDTSCFLASIPNVVPLSDLMLPGTHETMALYGWPISQCQSKSLDTQLHEGIRVIDIRLSIIDDRLIAHHGIFPEFTPFADMLITLHNFLTSPSTASETVVVSIKQEDSDTILFPQLVHEEIVASPGGLQMWYLENRIPNLGEVRGKAVMFSRFGNNGWENGANGIHPPIWPDSAKDGFQWECDGTLVRTQDWYNISSFASIAEKASLATEFLIHPTESPVPTLSVSFMSASSIPWALPPVIARGFGWPKWGLGFEGVNDRVGKWLLDQLCGDPANRRRDMPDHQCQTYALPETYDARLPSRVDAGPRIRGWVLMDYYEDPTDVGLVSLFIECNFRGRREGRMWDESQVP